MEITIKIKYRRYEDEYVELETKTFSDPSEAKQYIDDTIWAMEEEKARYQAKHT